MDQQNTSIDWNLLQSLLEQKKEQGLTLDQINKDNIFQYFQNNFQDEQALLNLLNANNIVHNIMTALYVRTNKGVLSYPQIGAKPTLISQKNNILAISTSGDYVLIGDSNTIDIYKNSKLIFTLSGNNLQLAEFSPDDTLFAIFDKLTIQVYSSVTFKEVFRIQNKLTKTIWPIFKFTENCLCYYNIQSQELLIYDSRTFQQIYKYGCFTTTSFSISSNYVSLIEIQKCLQTQTLPSKIIIYQQQNVILYDEIATSHEVSQLWSPDNTVLLVWTQLLDDQTNQSYYGVHNLIHIDLTTKLKKIIRHFEGPIHDVSWSAKNCFLVISGYMPAGTLLYDQSGQQLFTINNHHVNSIHWGYEDSLVALGGFGNLPGDIEIWDITKQKQIAKCKKDKVVQFLWSPGNEYFLTATTFPRLRVNSGFQIYNQNGEQIFDQTFEELYEVKWAPRINPTITKELEQQLQNRQTQEKKHIKTLSFQNADFIKEIKNQQRDCPRKLSDEDPYKQLLQKLENPSEQPQQQPKQQQQTIIRRQGPTQEQQQQQHHIQQQQQEQIVLKPEKKKRLNHKKKVNKVDKVENVETG